MKIGNLVQIIHEEALERGFYKCGMLPVEEMQGYVENLREREAIFPEAVPFLERFVGLGHPEQQVPWARTILITVWDFSGYRIPESLGMIGKSFLVDGVHSLRKRAVSGMDDFLTAQNIRFRTDHGIGLTAYRHAAVRAGLGRIRKNNFFYTERGSWVTLDAWLLAPELDWRETCSLPPCPAQCRACQKACPTQSLISPYAMNPGSCVACLTTFLGRDIPNEPFRDGMSDWIYGCDACQNVCPFNRASSLKMETCHDLEKLSELLAPERIMEMDEKTYRQEIQPQFWYLKPDELWKWKVNTLNYLEHHWREEYRPIVTHACHDVSEKVQKMARTVLSHLTQTSGGNF